MSVRWRSWLLALWAASVVGVLALNLVLPPPGLEDAWQWVGGMMAFPIAAALLLAWRPGNRVGLAMAVVGTATLVNFVLYWYALTYPAALLSGPAEAVSGAAVLPMFAGIVAVLYLFPTGSTLGGWHRWLFAVFVVVMAVGAVALLLAPGPLVETRRPNPLGVLPAWARWVVDDGFVVVPIFALIGVGSLVVRWRRAGTVERAQLRWFLTAAAFFVFMLSMVVFTGDDDDSESLGFVLASAFVMAGFWSVPAAIVVAVTKYRLYEIDRLISRTVSYTVVVASLAAIFALIAIGFPRLVGLPQDTPILVAGATLAAAALFNPFRRRVQVWVDRRFNRARYDAQHEIDLFAERLRAEMGLEDLRGGVLGVVARTMQPKSASVWIRDEGR